MDMNATTTNPSKPKSTNSNRYIKATMIRIKVMLYEDANADWIQRYLVKLYAPHSYL